MVKFSIDYINSASFFKKLDYSNKIILSSTADTLFIYDREKNKYILNACESFKVYNNKYLFNLRKDIYYYDGTRVTAHDYVKAIIEQQQLIPEFFINVLSINSTDTTIFIVLKKKDKKFINKLSFYLFSPHSKKTCGRYYISEISNKKIVLLPNEFYRDRAVDKLEFILCENIIEDNMYFSKRITDINNNTFLKLNNTNFKNEKSGIIFSIEVSTKFSINERNHIINSIDKNQINNQLGNSYFVKNDFFFDEISKYKYHNVKKLKKKKELRFFYNKYYPNYEISLLIKKELEKKNYDVKLFEIDYNDFKKLTDFDLKLVLNYFEYIDNLYFYNSNYFKYVMNKNHKYNFLLNKKILLKTINFLFKKKWIKEPLISFYSSYNSNEYTKYFSYLECNYNKIKDKNKN